ncbi:MFS transporter [Microvirga pudoricolor]|uniref:MFS transporter n=1 Tax=Microvirga pudoricolor TaxID=2778729 RepID=UPI00194E7093|nr:MFS transporter [Microvirga pudoricolor]MBM6595220.1 MFS transporter [Microvirga pudoricolor]
MLPSLLVIVCLVMAGMGMVAPVLSLYGQSFSVGATEAALVITMFGVGRFAADIPAGLLTERFGRKLLLWGGPALIAATSVGAALADDFVVLLIWRFLQGIGSGLYMTAAATALADLSSPTTRGRVMALYLGALLAGTSIGPALGGIVAEAWGITAPFWFWAASTALASAYALLRCRETQAKPAGHHESHFQMISQVVTKRNFLLVAGVTFSIFFTRTAANWGMIPLLGQQRFELGVNSIGIAISLIGFGTLIVMPIAGWICDHHGHKTIILMSSLFTALGLAVIALSPSINLYWAGVLLIGLATGLGGPASNAFAANTAPPGQYGPTMGILRAVGDAGFIVGPIAIGSTIDAVGIGFADGLLINAALVLLAGLSFRLGIRSIR